MPLLSPHSRRGPPAATPSSQTPAGSEPHSTDEGGVAGAGRQPAHSRPSEPSRPACGGLCVLLRLPGTRWPQTRRDGRAVREGAVSAALSLLLPGDASHRPRGRLLGSAARRPRDTPSGCMSVALSCREGLVHTGEEPETTGVCFLTVRRPEVPSRGGAESAPAGSCGAHLSRPLPAARRRSFQTRGCPPSASPRPRPASPLLTRTPAIRLGPTPASLASFRLVTFPNKAAL